MSLLLAEGRSPVDVARQAGHSPTMTLDMYGHIIEGLDPLQRLPADEEIRRARTPDRLDGDRPNPSTGIA